jgi:hypothetical protein
VATVAFPVVVAAAAVHPTTALTAVLVAMVGMGWFGSFPIREV